MTTTSTPPTDPEPSTLGDVLVEVGHLIDHTQYRLVTLAASFSSSDEWVHAGYRTAAHWIADHVGVCVATAREWIRVGRRLTELPQLDHAFRTRTLNYTKVRTLSRIATPASVEELIDLAHLTPADALGHALARWSKDNESDDERTSRHRRQRRLTYRIEPDGMVSGSFLLPPADAGIVMSAVDAEVMRRRAIEAADRVSPATTSLHPDPEGAFPSLPQQRADALVRLARGDSHAVETEMIVHVRGDGCSLDDGTPLSDSVVASMIPEAVLRALIHDAEGRPINASGRQRRASTRQRRVVKERDRYCVDCGSHDLLEYDHVPPYELTGRTLIDELELRCAPCHRKRHEADAA